MAFSAPTRHGVMYLAIFVDPMAKPAMYSMCFDEDEAMRHAEQMRGMVVELPITHDYRSCRDLGLSQVSGGPPCRYVSARAGSLRGHRAPMEHRDRRPVLDRRTTRGVAERSNQRTFNPRQPRDTP
jgi:hypothetical protein